ncbi:MAG: AraC family transcriptional regulator, partial [Bacteroidota bacterium]
EANLECKVTLEGLSRFMNMDKFHFVKEFRAKHGLSPINYVLMKKIFKAKALINNTTSLTQLAYRFEFSDQAHFSKQFKRYIGVSPRAYKKQLF